MATSSYTWTSSAAAKTNEFSRIQTNARHLGFTKNPHFPKTVAEYAQHQAGFKHDMAVEEREKLSYKIEASAARKRGVQGIGELMRGLKLGEKETEKVKMAGLFIPTSDSTRSKFSVYKGKGQKEEPISDGEGGYCKNEDKKFYKTGYSKVLGLRTDIWAGNEEELTEGKRKHNWDQHRAYWPENAEFRAEGAGRIDAALPRRLPRPRIDSFNKEAWFHHFGDAEMTFEEMTNRVRKLTTWSKDNLAIWKRQTVDFRAELDALFSIDRERNEDDMLIEALGIETVSAHGSLAAAVDAQAKVHGLWKKGHGTRWRPSGVKASKYSMAGGVRFDSPTMLIGSAVSSKRYGTRNAGDSNSLPSPIGGTSGSNTFSTPNNGAIPGSPEISGGGQNLTGPRIDNDMNTTLFATRTISNTLDPVSHYNQPTNRSHPGNSSNNANTSAASKAIPTQSAPINPSQPHNQTTHPTPQDHNSGNSFPNFLSSCPSIPHKNLAPALTSILYPGNKAYGADGNRHGEVPSEEGWVFNEEYLRERGWGGLLDELDKRGGK